MSLKIFTVILFLCLLGVIAGICLIVTGCGIKKQLSDKHKQRCGMALVIVSICAACFANLTSSVFFFTPFFPWVLGLVSLVSYNIYTYRQNSKMPEFVRALSKSSNSPKEIKDDIFVGWNTYESLILPRGAWFNGNCRKYFKAINNFANLQLQDNETELIPMQNKFRMMKALSFTCISFILSFVGIIPVSIIYSLVAATN